MTEDYIKLDSFMKWQNLVDTGGQAKLLIQNGEVRVNGKIETRRGRSSVFLPGIVFACCVFAVVFGTLSLLGPAISDTFNSIQNLTP